MGLNLSLDKAIAIIIIEEPRKNWNDDNYVLKQFVQDFIINYFYNDNNPILYTFYKMKNINWKYNTISELLYENPSEETFNAFLKIMNYYQNHQNIHHSKLENLFNNIRDNIFKSNLDDTKITFNDAKNIILSSKEIININLDIKKQLNDLLPKHGYCIVSTIIHLIRYSIWTIETLANILSTSPSHQFINALNKWYLCRSNLIIPNYPEIVDWFNEKFGIIYIEKVISYL